MTTIASEPVPPVARHESVASSGLDRWTIRVDDLNTAVSRHQRGVGSATGRIDCEAIGPRSFHRLAAATGLGDARIGKLRASGARAVLALRGGQVIGAALVQQGSVPVAEIGRTIDVAAFEHLLEIVEVTAATDSPGDRTTLLAAMARAAAEAAKGTDELTCLVGDSDTATAASLAALGWRRTGHESTVRVAGRSLARSRRHPPRQPTLPSAVRPTPAILVGGESWGSTLQAARSLGSIGASAHVITVGRGAEVFARSRHIVSAIDLERPDPTDLLGAITSLVAADPGDSPVPVIPLTDREVDLLDRIRGRLPERVRLALPASTLLRPLLHKADAMDMAEAAGIDVPERVVLSSAIEPGSGGHAEARRRAAEIPLPVILRPTAWETVGDRYFKLVVARSARQREEAIDKALASGAEVVLQHYLEVPEDAVELAILWRSADGSATAICTGRKRSATSPDGGIMAWGEAVALPDVEAAAEAFLDVSGFVGVGGIELIRDDGGLHFVEFNPRLEAIHFMAAAAGVDTVALAYRDLALGELPLTPVRAWPAAAWVGTAWLDRLRNRPGDLGMAVRARREFGIHPNSARSVWDRSDPLPALAVLWRLLSRGVRGRFEGR